ncbi:hypothetical protein [uncultured Ruegeria sp.]|uniref:hypothetical protein n=1 Tax=uncultured Ruegeria sp. TaxID=259304 RepID=UPI002628E58F|nr:hypothetical protein [uncultured Ruegeria sp.]
MILASKALLVVVLVALISAWSGVQAQAQNAHLELNARRTSVELEIVAPESAISCKVPMRPAKIDIVNALNPQTHDLSSFVETALRKKPVVVRRGGQTDTEGPESQARFASKSFSKVQAADVELRTVLYFCEYLGFPEFVGLVYTASGEVGNFTVHKRDAVTSDQGETFSLTFERGFKWYRDSNFGKSDTPDTTGRLHLSLELKDIPFQTQEGDGEMLVDLTLSSFVEFPMPESSQ